MPQQPLPLPPQPGALRSLRRRPRPLLARPPQRPLPPGRHRLHGGAGSAETLWPALPRPPARHLEEGLESEHGVAVLLLPPGQLLPPLRQALHPLLELLRDGRVPRASLTLVGT